MLQLETKGSLTTDNSMYVVVEEDSSQVYFFQIIYLHSFLGFYSFFGGTLFRKFR